MTVGANERFGGDSTIRWSTRAGDHVLWVRCTSPFADPSSAFEILDYWELRDGDFVTITNRVADLPAGFELHPTEVQDSLVPEMMRRLDAGHRPAPPTDASNLWRVRAGDRLVWVGQRRDGTRVHDGVLTLLTFDENALAAGDSRYADPFRVFGAPTQDRPDTASVARGRAGFMAAVRAGIPRTMATRWALG
jgi:hypothetical protein